MTAKKPQISETFLKERGDTYSRWKEVLNLQKEIHETRNAGVVSKKEIILIALISVCLGLILSVLGNADKDQMDAITAIGLVCVLLIYVSLPISLVLYIVIKRKLKKAIEQLDEEIANQTAETRREK
ncbi:hypothetical protein NPX99_07000 [Bartonella sp. 220]|uniref:hypothetical protein n=1 Tax=Bartonella sp. 220B TaxID=2967260 RepID=UPI0022A9EB0C|nr:hypothetical protein [Bartonella sp. 220B]MCZ2159008.1 hypothetical protein [Bartonella sp. 220B]